MRTDHDQRLKNVKRGGSQSVRFAVGEFRFYLGPGKAVIERVPADKYPHLTLAWYPQGLIDLHLTYNHATASRGDGQKKYLSMGSLEKPQLARLEAFLKDWTDRTMAVLFRQYRPMKPGWLSKRGYDVFLPQEERFQAFFKQHAPKKRGKHRLNVARLQDAEAWYALTSDSRYDPRVLQLLGPDEVRGPITAVGPRDTVQLMTWPPGAERGRWIGIKHRNFMRALRREYREPAEVIMGYLGPSHLQAFETIVREMGIEEVPALAETVEHTRKFLSNPSSVGWW